MTAVRRKEPLRYSGSMRAARQHAISDELEYQKQERLRELLGRDLDAAYQGDPAATSREEALFCYPGVTALIYYRMAHELYALGVPILPRIVCEIAHSDTGIDIHPGARIGGSFFIDHGVGVVIGATCVIGERVRLYQGVTLGTKSFPLDAQGHPIKGLPRHPIVEDDVVIYAGATILGRVTIGAGSSIGGNVWLTRSVPPGSRIAQAHARDLGHERALVASGPVRDVGGRAAHVVGNEVVNPRPASGIDGGHDARCGAGHHCLYGLARDGAGGDHAAVAVHHQIDAPIAVHVHRDDGAGAGVPRGGGLCLEGAIPPPHEQLDGGGARAGHHHVELAVLVQVGGGQSLHAE